MNGAIDGARRMRIVATGMLVAMAALFLIARALEPAHPGWGFVRAFAEAGMVGGLADWFAVTALFRHPLGLKLPHTAIIPTNKARIGGELARFLRANFLRTDRLARWMRRLDVARVAGRWLEHPDAGAAGRLRAGASRLFADMLEALDQERLGGMVRASLAQKLRELDLAPLLGQALAAAIADNRHLPLMDGMIRWASKVLTANEATIRAMVSARAGSILRWTGLDETLATKIIEGLDGMLADMADDPAHPLRAKAEEGLATLAHDLKTSPEMQARVRAFKAELLDNPALGDWWQGLWETARAGMLRIARDPQALTAGRLGEAMRQLGGTLRDDDALAAAINQFARRMVVGVAVSYGDGIVRLVSDTVESWDAHEITGKIEQAVGRDLQYIRVNGTVVGGLAGVAIHLVDVALR